MPQTLDQLSAGLKELKSVDAVWRQNNSYAKNAKGDIIALSLSGSEVESVVLDERPAALEYLYLAGNKGLKEVSFLASMPSLLQLNLSNCNLSSLKMPAGCKALRQVYIQNNRLSELEWSGEYPALELLDASNNAFERYALPTGLAGLKYLYLGDNKQLKELVIEPELKSLEILSIRNCQLEAAPVDTILSSPIEALYMAGNTPKNIPRVLLGNYSHNCLEDAQIWFQDLRDFPSDKNKVIKLMLTGNGNAGKSSLACALQDGKCVDDLLSTDGVDIRTLEMSDIHFNVWDFGGQEVYHGTHRLFIKSDGLQVILFDPETEEKARKSERVKDRIRDDYILNHPVEYWYETTKALSPDSQFFIVQNKKDQFQVKDSSLLLFADRKKAIFVHLSAKTGEDVEDLRFFLQKTARKLPDFDMLMPESWLKVRKFYIDNLQEEESKRIRLLSKQDFDQRCAEYNVREKTRRLLFDYLCACGFLYYHQNLGDTIIADQRWALEAIYKPYKRGEYHYEDFKNVVKGKIPVRWLFNAFGENYSKEQKWLFLSFMESCGLCFQLNREDGRSEKDIYVFPEFLPSEKVPSIADDWANKREKVQILRHRLPWLNYFSIQTFITALGRKTATDNFWRNGIQVPTDEGWFKVELDYDEKAVLLYIERTAMERWLLPIIEELRVEHEGYSWEISDGYGREFQPFNLEAWKQKQQEKLSVESMPNVNHTYDPAHILLFAANPTPERISIRLEHSHIDEKLKGRDLLDKYVVIPIFGTSLEMMNEKIKEHRPEIIHFIGHGIEENLDTHSGGGLYFHADDKQGQELIDGKTLGQIFQRLKLEVPQLKVVLLNACYSEPQARSISSSDIYAIGTSDEINSEAARKFAAGFYEEYLKNKDVIRAMNWGITQSLKANSEIGSLIHLFYNGKRIAP